MHTFFYSIHMILGSRVGVGGQGRGASLGCLMSGRGKAEVWEAASVSKWRGRVDNTLHACLFDPAMYSIA